LLTGIIAAAEAFRYGFEPRVETLSQRRETLGVRFAQVAAFQRIVGEIVQLPSHRSIPGFDPVKFPRKIEPGGVARKFVRRHWLNLSRVEIEARGIRRHFSF